MRFSGRLPTLVVVFLMAGVLLGPVGWAMLRPDAGVPITGPIQTDLGGETAVVFPDGAVVYLGAEGTPTGGRLPASTWAQVRRLLTSGRLTAEDETRGGCLDGGYYYGVDGPGLRLSWMLCSSAGGPSSPVRIEGAPTLSRVLTLVATVDRDGLAPLPEPPNGPPIRALAVTRTWVDESPGSDGAPLVPGVSDPRAFDVTIGGDVTVRDTDGKLVGSRHLDRGSADALRLLLSVAADPGSGPVTLACTTTRRSRRNVGPIFVPEHTSCESPPGTSLPAGAPELTWLASFVDLSLRP